MTTTTTTASTATGMFAVVAPRFTDPSGYELATVPRPALAKSDDILIRVHAASINPVDVKKASGVVKIFLTEEFPYKIGYDTAGVVEAVGPDVKRLSAGDAVFVRLPEAARGSWSEYAVCAERHVAKKPATLSFSDAASIPLAATTALQALQQYPGSLEGKTVFVPAGLSGTGAYALQLAKNVFHAGTVITTVSTAKVALVPQLLGAGVVDRIIDYTQEDLAAAIPAGSVDFMFDTTGQAMAMLSRMRPGSGLVVSIATTPSSATVQGSDIMQRPEHPRLPWAARVVLDALDGVRRLRARRWGVAYCYWGLKPNGVDLAALAGYVDAGQLRPVVGTRVDARDIAAVRAAALKVYHGKGGIGKTVLEIVK